MSKSNKKAKNTLYMIFVFIFVCIGIILGLYYSSIKFTDKQVALLEKEQPMVVEKESKPNVKIEETNKSENKNNSIAITIKPDAQVKKSSTKKIKLTDKYKTNALEIKTSTLEFGEVIYEYEDYQQHKLEISYDQISGLKNATIQNNINKEIEKIALDFKIDDEVNNNQIKSINAYVSVNGNFSDVLSLEIFKEICWLTDDSENPYEYETKINGINYILSSGEKIAFNDLFTEDASIKNILTQTVYDTFSKEYLYNSDSFSTDMNEVDYSKIERDTYRVLAAYNKNQNLDFYFSESYIHFIVNNKVCSIKMENFYDSIAIYNKYLSSKNLFLDPNLSKENYVFASNLNTKKYIEENKKSDNLYFELIDATYDENIENIENIEDVENILRKEIAIMLGEYINKANENMDKGYLVSICYDISTNNTTPNSYKKTTGYSIYVSISSCDKKYFDSNLDEIKAKVARSNNYDSGSTNLYYMIDEENCEFEFSLWKFVPDYTKPDKFENSSETKEERELSMQEYYSDERV